MTDIDKSLIREIVREVRDEIVDGEWKTIGKMAKDSGQSRRKIEKGITKRLFRSKMDGGLRMIHVPSWNSYIASCPEENDSPRERSRKSRKSDQ